MCWDACFGYGQARAPTGRHPISRVAGRGSPSATLIAKALFCCIGIIGMSGPIGLGDLRIILRALVDILNHQADRRAGGPALEHARKDADPVRLLPLRGVARLARPPLVQPGRSEEHTSELQSLMRISYAVFCLKKEKNQNSHT